MRQPRARPRGVPHPHRFALGDPHHARVDQDHLGAHERCRVGVDCVEMRGMGTTLVAALALGGMLAIAHVGDSRAYLLRGRRLERLTEDSPSRTPGSPPGGPPASCSS